MNKEVEEGIKQVALYTRVSTEDQAKEGFSLDAQLKRLEAHCIGQDWKIQDIYIDDGYTGTNTRRPQYTRMMENSKQWDAILVLKMDRIHRNQKNFTEMIDGLKKKGKDFVSATESLDTSTAMGRFVMNIIQGIAQLESEQNGERVTFAMKQKTLTTGDTGHKLAFGYKKDNGVIKEIPDRLEIVKKAFQLYSSGKSIGEISLLVGKSWGSVRYWLNNVWYIGYEQWSNCFKRHEMDPLIDLDLWNQTQRTKRNKTGRTQNLKPFIIDELQDQFTLSDAQMRRFGFSMDISKHKVGS